MGNELVSVKDKFANIRTMLEERKTQMAQSLPRHLDVNRMIRIALNSIQRTPKLLECSQVSLLNCVMQATALGLDTDGVLGEAYLIPFSGTATLLIGYKGLIKLARQSGQISSIAVRAVHEKDEFKHSYGLNETLHHVPSEEEDPGALRYVYAVARLKDGGVQWECMSRSEVESIRKKSRSGNSGPWSERYDEMAKKTVLRRLCKLLPASTELARAVGLDERAEAGVAQEFEDAQGEQPEPSKLTQFVKKKTQLELTPENTSPTEITTEREPGSDDT